MPTEFKSRTVEARGGAETIYELLSQPENLRKLIDNVDESRVPADKLEQLRKVEITTDSITLPGGPTGQVKLCLDRCERPSLISLKAADLPIDIILELHLKPLTPATSEAQCIIKADVPMMLKPMVKGPLQQVADKVVELISGIPFDANDN